MPPTRNLVTLSEAASRCTACELYQFGTRTVFGEGPAPAPMMVVGEQPGDKEDRAGHLFVGPAGLLLDEALRAAGVDRARVFVTNAVKHFYWEPRGKARIHKKPQARHIRACRGWLDAELEVVHPQVVVCLGATAAQAFLGPKFGLLASRGQVLHAPQAPQLIATYHPAAVLRMPDAAKRAEGRAAFFADFALAASLVDVAGAQPRP